MNRNTLTARRRLDQTVLMDVLNQYIVVIAVVLLAIYTSIVSPKFLTFENFQNILRQLGALSFAAIGMTFVIISGYFDLSIVGLFSLVSVVTIGSIPTMGEVPALLLGLGLGVTCGVLEAIVLVLAGARNGSDATFVTYGIGTAYGALALIYCGGQSIRLTGDTPIADFIGWGKIASLPVSFLIFVLAMAVANIFLMRTKTGTEIRMMGGNRETTRLVGVSNGKNTVIVFAILGLMAAIGGIISFSRTTTAAASCGVGFDTNSILAVVIGGTRLNGGVGSVLRTTIGIFLVTVLSNALNLIGFSSFMCEVIKGAFLILAIWLDYRRK